MSWDEIFQTIGPSLYGYILRKASRYNKTSYYTFQENIVSFIRSKIIDLVDSRKIEIQEGQIDTCVFQLKELGYLRFSENLHEDGEVFRGITLTEFGERCLSLLKTETR